MLLKLSYFIEVLNLFYCKFLQLRSRFGIKLKDLKELLFVERAQLNPASLLLGLHLVFLLLPFSCMFGEEAITPFC